jgi:hypothetical protein
MISVVRSRTGSFMPMWLIPMVYTAVSVVAGAVLPRIEQTYFAAYVHQMSDRRSRSSRRSVPA